MKGVSVRGFIVGVIVTLMVIGVGFYVFVRSGRFSMATSTPALPLEKTIAEFALSASIGDARDKVNPLIFNEENMLAGAQIYKDHCAGCHGLPGQPSAMFMTMFPPPPQLFNSDQMVTDDREGTTYWKVSNGIRLSGMPSFGNILTDTQRWQVTMTLAHADHLPPAVQDVVKPPSQAQNCNAGQEAAVGESGTSPASPCPPEHKGSSHRVHSHRFARAIP